jgi:hypothetical protein
MKWKIGRMEGCSTSVSLLANSYAGFGVRRSRGAVGHLFGLLTPATPGLLDS